MPKPQCALREWQAADRPDARKLSLMSGFDFLTDRNDLAQARWSAAPPVLASAQGVTVELERFALTANNLTYAKLGDALGYWRYFPAPQGWARTPVWGVGRVVEFGDAGPRQGRTRRSAFSRSRRTAL